MTQEELVEEALRIAREKAFPGMSEEDREELIEKAMLSLIDRKAMTPYFAKVGLTACGGFNASSGLYLMHEEPRRLSRMRRSKKSISVGFSGMAGRRGSSCIR